MLNREKYQTAVSYCSGIFTKTKPDTSVAVVVLQIHKENIDVGVNSHLGALVETIVCSRVSIYFEA